jgi:hypothetical protein
MRSVWKWKGLVCGCVSCGLCVVLCGGVGVRTQASIGRGSTSGG